MDVPAPPGLSLRPCRAADEPAVLALLPELADFALPPGRDPEPLWRSDAVLAQTVLHGGAPKSFLDLLVSEADDAVVGLALVTLRPELLSKAPSAHLEALVIHPDHRRQGLGAWLLDHCEARVRDLGAQSLTLHVFDRNARAKALYRRQGYDLELIRAVKWLAPPSTGAAADDRQENGGTRGGVHDC